MADHSRLASSVAALRPDFVLEGLPRVVLDVFGERGEAERCRRRASLPREVMEQFVGEALRDGLMPFQKEGVEFALKRQVRATDAFITKHKHM